RLMRDEPSGPATIRSAPRSRERPQGREMFLCSVLPTPCIGFSVGWAADSPQGLVPERAKGPGSGGGGNTTRTRTPQVRRSRLGLGAGAASPDPPRLTRASPSNALLEW